MGLPGTDPKVYVIILNYNGWLDTIECLESVLRLHHSNFRVILVDNDSTDGSVEKIELWAAGKLDVWRNVRNTLRSMTYPPVTKPIPIVEYNREKAESGGDPEMEKELYSSEDTPVSITLINSGGNLGFAGGNNVGIRYAIKDKDCQYIWLVNNDTVVDPDALTGLIERMQQKPEAGLCGSTLLYYHDPKKVQALAGASYNKWLAVSRHIGVWRDADTPVDKKEIESKLSYIIGASVLLSREFLELVGLMCEDYFFYFDELDWSVRAGSRFAMAYAPRSIVYHKEGGSIGVNPGVAHKSKLADYYWIKNRILFTRKFYPYALPTVYLGILAAIINRIRRKQWDRVLMIIKITLGL
jgi:GT2 family glycosyltransferase